MSTNNVQKTTAYIGIVLILSLGIFITAQYEKPNVSIVVPIQQQLTSVYIPAMPVKVVVTCSGHACSSQKHHYNPSPNIPCNIGKDARCSAVFTVNGKRTDYLK